MSNSRVVKDLEPERVFWYFAQISNIPRGSGNEEALCEYLIDFAVENGLEAIKDSNGNVIIKKDGTPGYESSPTVIIQGHVDMICAKDEDSVHDFEKDPVELIVDGDLMRANGTTLGADNGIAVAMALAILESNTISHPDIEALFTVDEESGMSGAENLDGTMFKGTVLINIDSEEEGVVLSSCAGGVRASVNQPVDWMVASKGYIPYKISIKGLQGGHSGSEIDKNRGNAIKLLGRVMEKLEIDLGSGFEIQKLDGGEKMNAIPKFADAYVRVDKSLEDKMLEILSQIHKDFMEELLISEPKYRMDMAKIQEDSKESSFVRVFSELTKKRTIDLIRLTPNGVQTMSSGMPGLVESSNNVGELMTTEDNVVLNSAVRSSIRSLKTEITHRMKTISRLTGSELELISDYPAWEYKKDSRIRQLMGEIWKDTYGTDLKVDAIHAGLECGFLKERIGDIDMVSLGPDIKDAHTPLENMSILSTGRVYKFILKVLESMNRY